MQEYRTKEIYGDFYENGNKPLVVVLGGSKPGLPRVGKNLLDYLRSNYNFLLLAYFGVGQLTKTLERVPIEYFVNAIQTIKEKHNLSDNRVILIGNSKGGEIALLLTKYLKSAITIACVPGCYVFQGLPINFFNMIFPKSSWSLNNKDVPYIKFYFDKNVMNDAKNKVYSTCYQKSLKHNFNQDAIINIDNYEGKILLLSAENDKFWPSKKMSEVLIENCKNNENLTHTVLDLEGHYYLEYEQSSKEIINYLETHASSLA